MLSSGFHWKGVSRLRIDSIKARQEKRGNDPCARTPAQAVCETLALAPPYIKW